MFKGKTIPQEKIPEHVGIIMDGNGRWAAQRGLARTYGHKKGVAVVQTAMECCLKYGVRVLSLFAFSTENWNRPEEEVKELFSLIRQYFKDYETWFMAHGVRVRVMGTRVRLDEDSLRGIEEIQNVTGENTRLTLNIGFNYGAREEILHAVNALLASGREFVTEEEFASELYTAGLPDPDLIIRTSGELRLSNFMLFQAAYAELYVTDVLWPDFDEAEFKKALLSYSRRKRRFGGLKGEK